MTIPTPSTPTMTVDDLISWKEQRGEIVPPFTADERSLARAAAEAWHFAHFLTEMPARAPRSPDNEGFMAMWMGVARVVRQRES